MIHSLGRIGDQEQKMGTKCKAIIANNIDPKVFTKDLAKHAIRKEISSLNVDQICDSELRDKIENNIKELS